MGGNPVLKSAAFAHEQTKLVTLNQRGITTAASLIHAKIKQESYKPQIWRTHPLHIVPTPPYDPWQLNSKRVLDFVFLVSALNFSFWSEHEGTSRQYGVTWYAGWQGDLRMTTKTWTGYWSLVAAINRAIEEGIPFTDPHFYSSPEKCPDSLIEQIFRPASDSMESIPLLKERIAVIREAGKIMCSDFDGSYQNLLLAMAKRHHGKINALDAVKFVVASFPCFRDQVRIGGRTVYFWKRAQILVAETWAAFHPDDANAKHMIFPEGVDELTMFADYRVPQILHHLQVLTYSSSLVNTLMSKKPLHYGSPEEVAIRSASILAVESICREIAYSNDTLHEGINANSVMIDFWLWDTAKKLERGEDAIDNTGYSSILPTHRTRSIWY